MTKLLFKNLLKSSILKNLSILVTGTIIAQIIVVIFQLVLSRIYKPEDFGAFAVYMSVVGIAITISSLRYEQAIVLPKSHKDAFQLTKLSIIISFIFVLLFAAFLFVFSSQFMELVGLSSNYKEWLVYLPISIFLFSSYQALNYLSIRLKLYSLSGSNKWMRRIVEGCFQTALGVLNKGFGLIIGDVVAHVLIILRTLNRSLKVIKGDEDVESKSTIKLAKRYKALPLKNALPSLMNALSRLLPILIISRVFDAETTGFFHYARIVLIIPLSLISTSLNQVLLQQFAQKSNNKHSVKKEATLLFYGLTIVAIIFAVLIKLFGTELFALVFGPVWEQSGIYAEILIWAFALKFIISPFNATFIAFEKITLGSLWQVLYFVLISTLLFINFDSIISFLKFYVVIELVAFAIAGIINFSILHQYEKKLTKGL